MRVHSHWRVPFDLPFILAKRCSCLNTTKVNISNFKKQDTWSNPPNNHLQIYSLQARLLVQGSTILPPVVGLQVTFPAAAEGFAGAAFLHSLGPNYSWWWMRNKTIRVGYVKGEKKKKNTAEKRERFSSELFSSQPLVRTQFLAHRTSELHSYSHNIHVQQSLSDSFKNASSWVECCLPGADNLCNAALFFSHKWDAPSRS